MAFEKFVPEQTMSSKPKVTIRPTGLISFDAAAVEAFGLEKSTHAVLFFDKAKKLVGVQLSKAGDEGAFKLSKRRRSVSLKAPDFFSKYALALGEAQRFNVARDDQSGLLLISLKSVQRRRGRPPRRRHS
jgi:hypothetical protein